MIAAPLSARLAARFGPKLVCGTGLTIFGLAMSSYLFSTQTMPQALVEVQMFGMGLGMGLTMSPATNAIMSAVPREKAGAGSAVNNTVRQVAGALGVAVLGSILVVAFRGQLGENAPKDLASRLDQPAAVVAKLPADQQARTYVTGDSAQSIGNAFEFVGGVSGALGRRAQNPQLSTVPPAQVQQAQRQARAEITRFVDNSKSAFMSGMHITSVVAGLMALVGAVIAFLFLPGRREYQQAGRPAPAAEAEPVSEVAPA